MTMLTCKVCQASIRIAVNGLPPHKSWTRIQREVAKQGWWVRITYMVTPHTMLLHQSIRSRLLQYGDVLSPQDDWPRCDKHSPIQHNAFYVKL